MMDPESGNHRANGPKSCIHPENQEIHGPETSAEHHNLSLAIDTQRPQPSCCCSVPVTSEPMDSPLRQSSANTTHTSAYYTPPSHLKDFHESDSLDYIGPTASTPQSAHDSTWQPLPQTPVVATSASTVAGRNAGVQEPDGISPIAAQRSSPSPVRCTIEGTNYHLMGAVSNVSMQSSFSDDSLVVSSQRPRFTDGRYAGPPGILYTQSNIMAGPGGFGMQYAVRPVNMNVNMMCSPYSAEGGRNMYMAGPGPPRSSVVSPIMTPTSLPPPNMGHAHHSHGTNCCSHCGTAATAAEIPSHGLISGRWPTPYEVVPLSSLSTSTPGHVSGNGDYLWTNPYAYPNTVSTKGHSERHGTASGPYMETCSAPATPLIAAPSPYLQSPFPLDPSPTAAQTRPGSNSHLEEDSLNDSPLKVSPSSPVQSPANPSPSLVPIEPANPPATAVKTAIAAQVEVITAEVIEEAKPLPGPLAFTIDFGETKKDTPKRVFPSKHRRTPSSQSAVTVPPSEDTTAHRKSQESETAPVEGKMLKMRMPLDFKKGYFAASEGYFSSDQEEEHSSRRNNASVKPSRNSSVPTTRRPALQHTESNSETRRTVSPSPSPVYSAKEAVTVPRNNNQVLLATNESSRPLQYHVNSLKNPSNTPAGSRPDDLKESHTNGRKSSSGSLSKKEEDDDLSETGTYTVDKESHSPEEEQSRKDIERVFGLDCNKTLRNSPDQDQGETKGSARGTPNWICEWAAQVAQQQQQQQQSTKSGTEAQFTAKRRSSRDPTPNRGNVVTTSKPPAGPVNNGRPAPEGITGRPRRRLPSLPTQGHSRSRSSPLNSDLSDADSPTGNKSSTASYSDRQSPMSNFKGRGENSQETELFLRDTESVVSAMQARVDRNRGFASSSLESHDSGGDSDMDTSTSYSVVTPTATTPRAKSAETCRDFGVESTSRRLTASAKAKLKTFDSDDLSGKALLRETSYVVHRGHRLESAEVAKYANSVSPSSENEPNGKFYEDSKSFQSDTESEGTESPRVVPNPTPTIRYNRALSLRRGRLGLDTDVQSQERRRGATVSPSPTPTTLHQTRKPTSSSKPPSSLKNFVPAAAEGQKTAFSRSDGGRFSLRVSAKSQADKTQGAKPKVAKTPSSGFRQPMSHSPSPNPVGSVPTGGNQNNGANAQGGRRSSSTLSSKEAEFQNWKRRKTYDPMKAAAEGRKKDVAKKQVNEGSHRVDPVPPMMSRSMMAPSLSPCRSPSPSRTIIRSASFTYVNDSQAEDECSVFMPQDQLPAKQVHQHWEERTSDREDLCLDLQKLSLRPSGVGRLHAANRVSELETVEDNSSLSPSSPRRKGLGDDSSDVTRVSRSSNSSSSIRTRSKLEALDNLVINTIFGLSGKIRCHADALLRKLKPQFADDMERLAALDDSLLRLSEAETPPGPQMAARSTSRELSGTLKIMKRIEQVFLVLDQVLFEEGVEGGGEGTINLEDVGGKWNGYHSGDFY